MMKKVIFAVLLIIILSINVNALHNKCLNKQEKNNYLFLNDYSIMNTPIIIDEIEKNDLIFQKTLIDTPSEFSWKNYKGQDWTTPAKNQGNCGSCWDFAAIGALESIINIREDSSDLDMDLSEQYVLSCLPKAANNYGQGCMGGNPYKAFLYMMENTSDGNNVNGAIPESCLPYQASDDVSCSDKCEYWDEYLVPISDCGEVWIGLDNAEEVDIIKTYVYDIGPIAAGMNVTSGFVRYWQLRHNPELFYPDTNEPWGNRLNHIIVIVGWKDDPSIGNGGYWICKNSWGTEWGYDGFFNIEYGGLFTGCWFAWANYSNSNQKPEKPMKPIGNSNGVMNQIYNYSTSTIDPENENVYYLFDWGDSTYSEWIGPYDSGQHIVLSHSWNNKGTYEIRVKSKDIHFLESEWSEPLAVSIPKSKSYTFNLFETIRQQLLFHFPFLSKIIN